MLSPWSPSRSACLLWSPTPPPAPTSLPAICSLLSRRKALPSHSSSLKQCVFISLSKHGMKRSPVCTNPTVFPVANSHFLSSIQGIVAQKAGGDRQTLDSMMGKEFPIASFTLYSLTRFLGASPKFCKAEFLLASSKVLNNISGF